MVIDKSLLYIDRAYQREENEKKVKEFAANFSWQSCGVIIVMERSDGFYLVVDGQHRVLAAFRRSDIKTMPCLVFPSTSIASEAECFINTNTSRKPVTAYDKFKASLVSENSMAVELQQICQENGLILRRHSQAVGTITCVAACQRIMRTQGGSNALRRSLSLAAELAAAENINVSDILLTGLSYLDFHIEGGLNNTRLRQQLIKIGAKALVESARKMAYRIDAGGAKSWAEGMLEIVNRSLRSKLSFTKTAVR